MSIDRPEHGPRRYICRIVLPVALLTASAIVLLHAWVEADLRAHLLLQSSALSETGVVEVGSLGNNRGIDHLVSVAQEVRWRWTLLLVSIGAFSAALAGTRSVEMTRFPRALHA